MTAKRRQAGRLLFLLVVLTGLLAGPAFADSGPKPRLAIQVRNGPEELYYMDILCQSEAGDGLSQEEREKLDQELLSKLLAAVPEGWHTCIAEEARWPVWGDLTGEGGLHVFWYVGLPKTYRILMVTRSGEVWISDVLQREVLQSSVTVDWAERRVEQPPLWRGYLLQFFSTLLPTLLVEGTVFFLFRLDWKRNWKAFLLINLATQGALSAWMSLRVIRNGTAVWYFLPLLLAEVLIAFGEARLFQKLFRGYNSQRAFAYGLTANACSAVLGWYLVEPVWKWIVSACLI